MGQARRKKLLAPADGSAPKGVVTVMRKVTVDVPYEDYAHLAEVAAQITAGHRKRAGHMMMRGWRIITVGDVARVAIRSYLDALSREMNQIAEWQAKAIAEHEAKQALAAEPSPSDLQIAKGDLVELSTT